MDDWDRMWQMLDQVATNAFWAGVAATLIALGIYFSLFTTPPPGSAVSRRRMVNSFIDISFAFFASAAVIMVLSIVNAPEQTLNRGASASLRVAWQHWLKGDDLTRLDIHVLRLSLHVWGRIGKILEGLAGLAIVIDVIGEARLRDWAYTIKGPDKAAEVLSAYLMKRTRLPAYVFGLIASLTAILFSKPENISLKTVGGASGFIIAVAVETILFVLLFGMFVMAAILYLKAPLFGLSWLLSKPIGIRVVRASAAILFIVGIHFDILAA